MAEHFSDEQIERFMQNRMQAGELLEADEHLQNCDACYKKISGKMRLAGVELFPLPESDAGHLTFEQFERYVDENIDEIEREIADVHLADCNDCRANLQNLAAMRKLIAADLSPQGQPKAAGTTFERIREIFSGYHLMRFGLGAFALLIIISVIGVFWLSRKNAPPEIASNAAPSKVNDESNQQLSNAALEPNVQTNAPANAAARDSNPGGNQNSNPGGNQDAAPENSLPKFDFEIQQVLTAQKLKFPPELNQLSGQTGKLMSGGSEQIPFALLSPVGKIIQSERPRLQWRGLDGGAESYRVDIYDANFTKIAASPALSQPVWQVDRPLGRGKIYIWQVTAIKNGQEVKSPVRPAPDAKFKIIEANKAAELAAAKRKFPDSPLLMGILFAKAGLLDEAEREFQKEINKNPQSQTARKFLQEVRARRGN